MPQKKKYIIWSVVAVLILAVSAFIFYSLTKKKQPEYTLATVERGDIAQTVSVAGSLVDQREVNVDFETSGRVEDIFFKEGERIAQGEILATLDDANLSLLRDQAEASLKKARAENEGSDESLRELEEEKDRAEEYLDQTKKLNDQKLDEADKAISNAEDYYDDVKDYYEENKTAQNKITLTSAENSVKSAKEAKKTLEQQSELSEVSAENSLKAIESRIETFEADSSEDSRDAILENAKKSLELAETNLKKSSLISPVNGTIATLDFKKGEVWGATAGHFAKIIGSDLMIEARVPESDVSKLKRGAEAEFTLDSLSENEKFKARVVEISPSGTNVQDVISYKTTFMAENMDDRFKPEMTVNLDILTDKKTGVLKIPLRAVKMDGELKYVEILSAENKPERREITTGLEGDEGLVEIKSGLSEGEKVITLKKE